MPTEIDIEGLLNKMFYFRTIESFMVAGNFDETDRYVIVCHWSNLRAS